MKSSKVRERMRSARGFVHFELIDPGSGNSVAVEDGAQGIVVEPGLDPLPDERRVQPGGGEPMQCDHESGVAERLVVGPGRPGEIGGRPLMIVEGAGADIQLERPTHLPVETPQAAPQVPAPPAPPHTGHR